MLSHASTTLRRGLLVASVGMAVSASRADAALATHSFTSNAVNYCQAFTPGSSNTLRNRALGSQNFSPLPLAIACNFHSMNNGHANNTAPTELVVYFTNRDSFTAITVYCTLLTGHQTETGTSIYAVTRNTGPFGGLGASSRGRIIWNPSDNPVPGATTLGNRLIGITCRLPPDATINDVHLYWTQDNGI